MKRAIRYYVVHYSYQYYVETGVVLNAYVLHSRLFFCFSETPEKLRFASYHDHLEHVCGKGGDITYFQDSHLLIRTAF